MNIPIVMLHHVADSPHATLEKWSIGHQKFLELLDCIEEKGLKTSTFREITERGWKQADLTNKIILTFDDCPISLFDFAIPELLKRKMKAVFYIPTDQIDGLNTWDIDELGTIPVSLMNAEQLIHLQSNGMEIGSHGEKHIRLTEASNELAFAEISNSKQVLTDLLDSKVYSFAYPYGKVPKRHQQMLIKSGYNFGISIYSPFETKFSLRRFAIHDTDDLEKIRFKLSKRYNIMRYFYDPIFLLKKKLLG